MPLFAFSTLLAFVFLALRFRIVTHSPAFASPLLCHKQEGADVCQECDAAKPYTASVQTTSAAGCWDDDFRSSIDMVVRGT